MSTTYVKLSSKELKTLMPEYKATALVEIVLDLMWQKLKKDKKYMENFGDDLTLRIFSEPLKAPLLKVLRQLKATPSSLQLYTNTSVFSSDSSLLLKMSCDGPLSDKAIKLEVDWVEFKESLKKRGKLGDTAEKRDVHPLLIIDEKDLAAYLRPHMGDADGFELGRITVRAILNDKETLDTLFGAGDEKLIKDVDRSVDIGREARALAEIILECWEKAVSDPSSTSRQEQMAISGVERWARYVCERAIGDLARSAGLAAHTVPIDIKCDVGLVMDPGAAILAGRQRVAKGVDVGQTSFSTALATFKRLSQEGLRIRNHARYASDVAEVLADPRNFTSQPEVDEAKKDLADSIKKALNHTQRSFDELRTARSATLRGKDKLGVLRAKVRSGEIEGPDGVEDDLRSVMAHCDVLGDRCYKVLNDGLVAVEGVEKLEQSLFLGQRADGDGLAALLAYAEDVQKLEREGCPIPAPPPA